MVRRVLPNTVATCGPDSRARVGGCHFMTHASAKQVHVANLLHDLTVDFKALRLSSVFSNKISCSW